MTQNPYASPTADSIALSADSSPERLAAQRKLRLSLLILLVPAVYNYYCFDSQAFGSVRNGVPIPILFRTVNILGMVIAFTLVWFLAMPALEWITKCIQRVFAKTTELSAWQEVLYSVSERSPLFAIPGAVLWLIWTIGVYHLNLNFYLVSFPIGILAHLLAAGLYLPLFYRWYLVASTPDR